MQGPRGWRKLVREVAAGIARLEQSLGIDRMEPLVEKREIHSLQWVGAANVQELQPVKPATMYKQVKLPRLEIMDRDLTSCKWLEKISDPGPEDRVIEAPRPSRHKDVLRWFEIMSEMEERDSGADVDLIEETGRCLRDS